MTNKLVTTTHPRPKEISMKQTGHNQVSRMATWPRTHQSVSAAALALVATVAVLALAGVIGSGATTSTGRRAQTSVPVTNAGPAVGTPSAVAAALSHAPESALPNSLTTNVPAPARIEAGPTSGTPAAVREALSSR